MSYEGYVRSNFKPKHISRKMKKLATDIVDNDCWNIIDRTPIVGEDRDILIAEFCENMKLGEMITWKKYLCIGGILGIAVTAGFFKIKEIIKDQGEEA